MIKIISLGAFLLLAGCSTPAIIPTQLGVNSTQLIKSSDKLIGQCIAVVTTTQTPSSWWSYVAPVRQVTSQVECLK